VPGAQDEQLAVAGGKLPGQQLAAEGQPPPEQPGVAHEGGEDVGGPGRLPAGLGQQLAGLVVLVVGRQGRDAERVRHGQASYCLRSPVK
jgi:hypothetical protein